MQVSDELKSVVEQLAFYDHENDTDIVGYLMELMTKLREVKATPENVHSVLLEAKLEMIDAGTLDAHASEVMGLVDRFITLSASVFL